MWINLTEAGRRMPVPRSRHVVWLWVKRGFKSSTGSAVKLRAVQMGSRWFTSDEWVKTFLAAQAEANAVAPPARKTTKPRAAVPSHAKARRKLQSV